MSSIHIMRQHGDTVEIPYERCLCNNVIFGDEFNPHKVKPWIIGNEYGVLCLVWGDCEQDALDAACDGDMLAGLAIDEKDALEKEEKYGGEGVMRLGNASEPFDSTYAWIEAVRLTAIQERCFSEARGANQTTLDK